jgi:phage-related protein
MKRKILFYKNHFNVFYLSLPARDQEKIDFVLDKIKTLQWIPGKFLLHIKGTDGLYEIRVFYRNLSIRIFCCFDSNSLVVLFNAFQKKDQKTPRKEIETALRLKKEYFQEAKQR